MKRLTAKITIVVFLALAICIGALAYAQVPGSTRYGIIEQLSKAAAALLYVRKAGDTMTGSLVIEGGSLHASSNVTSASLVAGSSGITTAGDFCLDGYDVTNTALETDAAPRSLEVYAPSAWAGASSNTTGGSIVQAPGTGTRQFSVVGYTNCSSDTMTITINGSASTCVEGTGWDAVTDNATSCIGLAACIDALSGVSAECSGTTVRVTKDAGTYKIDSVATSDVTCATVINGTDGTMKLQANTSVAGTLAVSGTSSFTGAITAIGGVSGTLSGPLNGSHATLTGFFRLSNPGSITVAAATGITSTQAKADSYLVVGGNGGAVDITASPQIGAGYAGQLTVIRGTSDTNTVKFDDGDGMKMAASCTLGLNDILMIFFDGTSTWIEIACSDN